MPTAPPAPSHYFQAINLVFRIFDKDGNPVLGPLPTASLWSGLGGICETGIAGTPLVRYDSSPRAGSSAQVGFDPSDASAHACIAVFDDARIRPDLQPVRLSSLASGSIATSARLGIWPEAYYLTVNQVNGFAERGVRNLRLRPLRDAGR